MAHMNRISIYDSVLSVRREKDDIGAGVRAKIFSNKLPGAALALYACEWGEKAAFGASPRSYAAGEWMFEHRAASLTPDTTRWWDDRSFTDMSHSPVAPCHDIRYSWWPS